MSVQSGNEVQERVGRVLAHIRVDDLGLRNNDMAKAFSTHAGRKITNSRISEAEHGRANLNHEYVALFLNFLHDTNKEAWDRVQGLASFMDDVAKLPEFAIRNHSNAGQEGNYSHEPKSPPIARMLQQRKQRKLQAQTEATFSVSFSDGAMILTTPDFRITVEQV